MNQNTEDLDDIPAVHLDGQSDFTPETVKKEEKEAIIPQAQMVQQPWSFTTNCYMCLIEFFFSFTIDPSGNILI